MPLSRLVRRSRLSRVGAWCCLLVAACAGTADAPVNHVPGPQRTAQGVPLSFSASSGNSIGVDVDGDGLARVVLAAEHGALTLSGTDGLAFSEGTGTGDVRMVFTGLEAAANAALEGLAFTPEPGFAGTVRLTIETSDERYWPWAPTMADADEVVITVLGEAHPPVAAADAFSALEDTPLELLVLANDSDPDGDALTITSVTQPAHGVVTLDAGSIVYTPAAEYSGPDAFTYTVSDGMGQTATAEVSVQVEAVNDAPRNAVPGAQEIAEDRTLRFSAETGNGLSVEDVDAGGAIEQVTISATHGIVTLGDPSGVSVTAGASGTASVTFTGTLAGLNAALEGLTFSPDPVLGVQTTAMLTLASEDLGSSGAGGARSDTDTVLVTVHPVEHAPVAVDDVASTAEDTAVDVWVLANDTDQDDDPLTVTVATSDAGGSVLVGDGTHVRYTPPAEFSGTDTLRYTISDGRGGTASATVTVTVSAVNDAPVITAPALVSMDEEATFSFSGGSAVSIADPDAGPTAQVTLTASGGRITVGTSGATLGGNGTAAVTISGSLAEIDAALADMRFTAPTVPGRANGSATIQLVSSDGALTDTDEISVVLLPIEHDPIAVDDAATTTEGTAVDVAVRANDSDPDGDTLTVVDLSFASNGDLDAGDGTQVRYTPNPGFTGTDSFAYWVSDGHGRTASATVRVTVNAVNDPPVNTVPGTQQVNEEGTLVFSAANGNPVSIADPEGASVQVTLTATGGTITVDAGDATVTGNGSATVVVSGTLAAVNPALAGMRFTAPTVPGRANGSATIRIVSSDGALTDTDEISVVLLPIEHDPVAVDDTATTPEDTAVDVAVLANDSDPDGDTLTVTAAGPPSNGSADYGDGTHVHYIPNPDFGGTDTFSYTVSDGHARTATATVRVTVNAVNDPPAITAPAEVMVDEEATFAFTGGSAISITDPDGAIERVALSTTDGTIHVGTFAGVTVTGDGTATVNVSGPLAGVNAVLAGATFTAALVPGSTQTRATLEVACNDGALSDIAGISVLVLPVEHAPVAEDDAATTSEDTAVTIDVTGNDRDVDGDALTLTSVASTAGGSALILNGEVRYTPPLNFNGVDTVSYTISDRSDGTGRTASATVTVTVGPVNDAPLAVDDVYVSVNHDAPTLLPVLANDTDVEGDTLSVHGVGAPAHGTAAVEGTSIRYVPTTGYSGPDSFTYTVSDGNGGTDTGTVTLRVNAVFQATGNTLLSFSTTALLQNDPTGSQVVSLGAVTPTGATATLRSGNVDFLPAAGNRVTHAFQYTVRPPSGPDTTGTVEVTISGMIWYVKADAAAGGDGRCQSAFSAVTSVMTPSQTGDSIYVAPGTYAGGLTLKANQVLTGATATQDGTIWQWTANPAAAVGARPAITNASGAALVLASGNTVQGLRLTGTNTTNLAIGGTISGTTRLEHVDVVSSEQPGVAIPGIRLAASSTSSLTMADVQLTNVKGDAVHVEVTSSSLTLALASLMVKGTTDFGNGVLVRADGRPSGSPDITLTLASSTFSGVTGDAVNVAAEDGATVHATIGTDQEPNTFTGGGLGDSAVRIGASGSNTEATTASTYFRVTGNTFTGWNGTAVSVAGDGRLDGTISGNTIGTGSTSNSAGSVFGDGIGVLLDPGPGTTSMAGVVLIDQNDIWVGQGGGSGIFGLARAGADPGANKLNLVLTSNTIHSAGTGYQGIFLGVESATSLCAELSGNSAVAGARVVPTVEIDAYLLQAVKVDSLVPSLSIQGVAEGRTASDAQSYLLSSNTGTPLTVTLPTGRLTGSVPPDGCTRPTSF